MKIGGIWGSMWQMMGRSRARRRNFIWSTGSVCHSSFWNVKVQPMLWRRLGTIGTFPSTYGPRVVSSRDQSDITSEIVMKTSAWFQLVLFWRRLWMIAWGKLSMLFSIWRTLVASTLRTSQLVKSQISRAYQHHRVIRESLDWQSLPSVHEFDSDFTESKFNEDQRKCIWKAFPRDGKHDFGKGLRAMLAKRISNRKARDIS